MFIKRQFDFELIKEKYEEDFPTLERKSNSKMKEMLSTERYVLYICYGESSDDFYGYVTVFSDGERAWIDYLAVSKEVRGLGVGTFIITELSKRYNILLFEVEKDDFIENSQKNKRQRFYKKLGAKLLTPLYELPTFGGSLAMDLLILKDEKSFVNFAQIREFIKNAVCFIHSDFEHTSEIIAKYIDEIG